jgi:hypothetical protein
MANGRPAGGPKKPQRTVLQMPGFGRNKKRLSPKQQLAVDAAMKDIIANPLLGEPKTGALRAVRVHKFKVDALQVLLAYKFDEKKNVVEVWAAHGRRVRTAR